MIEAKTVKPNTFIDYIQAANATDAAYRDNATTKAYKYYQVATNSEALDNYLANLLPDNFDHADIVKTLKIILPIRFQRFCKRSRIALMNRM